MRANGNFGDVKASQGEGGGMLQPGGYAAQIFEVIDGTEEPRPYLDLVLNILDPETKRMRDTQDLADPERWWRHTYRYFLTSWDGDGINWARYKALTDAVEQTSQNNGFKYQDADGGERQLVGKWVGVVLRRYLYVPKRGKHAGEQREGLELSRVLTAADALAGNFDQRYAATRDGRPDNLKGTPFPPEPTVVKAPAETEQPATPANAAPTPANAAPTAPTAPAAVDPGALYAEDIPF